MAVTTRQAILEDAEAIATAHMRSWQQAYKGIVNQDFLDNMDLPRRIDHWRDNLSSDTLANGWPAPTDFVAEVDGEIAGFVNVGIWRQAPEDRSLAELWAIYVHPDYWGTGAGYALMQDAMAQFRLENIETAYLWVLDDNDLARRFYERQGWNGDDVTQEEDIAGQILVERRYSISP